MKAIEKQKEIPSSLCDATRNRRPARKCRNPQGCSLIDDAKKSDYVLASTSHPDSNELASTSVQTSKAKNVMVAPEHGHFLELAESCNLQVPSIPQSLREAVVKVSDSLFNSLPATHRDMQYGQPSMSSSMEVTGEGLSEPEGIGLLDTAKFCSGSRFNNAVIGSSTRTGCLLSERTKVCVDVMRKKLFQPYWSDQAVNESLKAGEAFKANFRINAHNRLEGYCTINGVTTDILINGASAQNRAIEGDVVAIVIDPVSSWPRLKGSARKQVINIGSMKDGVSPEVIDCVMESAQDELVDIGNCFVDDAYPSCDHPGRSVKDDGSLVEEIVEDDVWDLENKGDASNCVCLNDSVCQHQAGNELVSYLESRHFVNGDTKYQIAGQHCSSCELFDEQDEAGKALANLIETVRLRSNKRPTGRVVAIIDGSARRNAVIGFLEVKQNSSKEVKGGFSRNEQCMNSSLKGRPSTMKLIPTDPRFQKMVVLESSLPDCIRNRLLDGDATVGRELVVACIDAWRPENYLPLAVVTQSLGGGEKIEAQMAAILIEHSVHSADFQPDSLACLPKFPWKIPSEEFKKRRDLRDLCIFSIDPPTARDLDDALSIQSVGNGVTRVGVHVADVSYFVLANTPLDVEAQYRTTSVYLIGQVIPMLPRVLSEELCSLNPGVDRLAFSIMWDMDPSGEILDHWIGRTIIRSCCKLSYQHAQEILDGTSYSKIVSCRTEWPELHGSFQWQDITADIRSLNEIAKRRRNDRFEKGALRLDNSKLVFKLDNDGMPCESMLYEHKDSNFLVEEFMLLANMTVAKVISRAFPDRALLRRQPEPSLRKLEDLEGFCIKHGFELDTSSSGKLYLSLEKMQEKLKNDPVLYNILILYATKAMQLAKYFCTGELRDKETDWAHYALATPLYTHFTSPIRRYPDVVVHRTLAAVLEAEELYFKELSSSMKTGMQNSFFSKSSNICFTGPTFNKEAAESAAGRKALAAAAFKHKVPGTAELTLLVAHCNERKLASRYAQEASEKLYLLTYLRRKQILFSDARVLALGQRFMSIYVYKLAMERRIYFDDIEGLVVEWYEATGVLLLSIVSGKLSKKRRNGKCRTIEDIALVVNPTKSGSFGVEEEIYEDILAGGRVKGESLDTDGLDFGTNCLQNKDETEPGVFPLTLRPLSSVPVSINVVEGDNMPPDISVRLYLSSYLI